MKKLALLFVVSIVAIAVLNGCATYRYGWVTPPNMTRSQIQQDKEECYKLSVIAPHSGLSSAAAFLTLGIIGEQRAVKEQRIYRRCLMMKGWRWEKLEE